MSESRYIYELKTKVSAWSESAKYLTREAAETCRRESIRLGLEVGPVKEIQKEGT